MTNIWMPSVGLPLMVLAVRLVLVGNSLVRQRRAGYASVPGLQVPYREGVTWFIIGGISSVIGLLDYLFLSPQGQVIMYTGSSLAVLGICQLIQARAQRLPEPDRLKSERLTGVAGCLRFSSEALSFSFMQAWPYEGWRVRF